MAPLHHRSPHFTPIRESEREDKEDEGEQAPPPPPKHPPTPIHHHNYSKCTGKSPATGRKPPEFVAGSREDDRSVSCNKCRPSAREKISIVPLDNSNGAGRHSSVMASPNAVFRSIVASLTRRSPKPLSDSASPATAAAAAAREEQWKLAVAELSSKLIQTTRKRDEAILEASRLKYSMVELEKKLNKLEIYCHNLKSGLEVCTSANSPYRHPNPQPNRMETLSNNDKVIQHFLISVSEARSSIRLLSRSLTLQIRQMGGRVHDRISQLLKPYDCKFSPKQNPRSSLFYLEAVLNRAFFEDFESVGFEKSSSNSILNPIDRCEANFIAFESLKGLNWEEVLNKGTKHFSEEFSGFCDRKMSEIVGTLGWSRAWPEPLLQAFFSASKSVWLVHLLATSVHPGLPIFRVENGSRFDPVYMEDMGADKTRRLVPTAVRALVAPGFYIYGNVVKSKVLCRYHSWSNGHVDDKALTLTPSPSVWYKEAFANVKGGRMLFRRTQTSALSEMTCLRQRVSGRGGRTPRTLDTDVSGRQRLSKCGWWTSWTLDTSRRWTTNVYAFSTIFSPEFRHILRISSV